MFYLIKTIVPDPRIIEGSLIRGNKYADYGVTIPGSVWVVYKVLQPLQEIPFIAPVSGYQDIMVGPRNIEIFIDYQRGLFPSPEDYYRKDIYPVTAARFDYIRDLKEFGGSLRNNQFLSLLKPR